MTEMRLELRGSVVPKFLAQARAVGQSPEHHAALLVDNGVAPEQLIPNGARHAAVKSLARLVSQLPGVSGRIGVSKPNDAFWWVKFSIDPGHELAWHVVQLLGYVLNYYSLEFKFQTKFYPASPPPYLNGGPRDFLSWVIEAQLGYVDPRPIVKALRAELPRRPASAAEWKRYD